MVRLVGSTARYERDERDSAVGSEARAGGIAYGEARLVLDAHARVGEGPVWDARSAALVWVDILAPAIYTYRPSDGSTSALGLDHDVGACAPRQDGGFVLALDDGFALLDPGSQSPRLIAPVEADDPTTRFNDGRCDPRGRFWAGTMAYDERAAAGALYRLDPDGRVERVLDGLTISNGLDWSPDGRLLYFIDTATGGIDAFDYDAETGAIAGRRRLVTIDQNDGWPDGMTVDAEGHLWVALWGGWSVRRYAPDGRLEQVVRLPVAQVSSCAFGGDELDDLYITTAADGLGPEALRAQPHAGGLFHCRPSVKGRPANLYAG